MTRGLYAAASGAAAALERLDAVANNLANVNTVGFKASHPVFRVRGDGDDSAEALAISPAQQQGVAQVVEAGTDRDFSPGSARQTGNPLDVAIEGQGFFVVNTTRGERYTRQGSFALDGEGYLVMQHGERVQGEQGDIRLEHEPQIASDGSVSVDGSIVGKLKVVGFGERPPLTPEGTSLFAAAAGTAQPLKEGDVHLQQGAVESSNVDAVESLMELIDVSRGFESYMKTLQRLDEIGQRSINDVGRV